MNREQLLFTVLEVLQNQKRNAPVRYRLPVQFQFAPISKRFQEAATIPQKNMKQLNGTRLTNKDAKIVKKLAHRNYRKRPVSPLTQAQINAKKRMENNEIRRLMNWMKKSH